MHHKEQVHGAGERSADTGQDHHPASESVEVDPLTAQRICERQVRDIWACTQPVLFHKNVWKRGSPSS